MKTPPVLLTDDEGHVILQSATPQAMADLAARHRAAEGITMQLLSSAGGQIENVYLALPQPVRKPVEAATLRALEGCFTAAHLSRKSGMRDQSQRMNSALATAMGALGGLGGLPTALVELPFSTVLLMRAIIAISLEYGFDPHHEETRRDCLQVFAAGGPMEADDGADLGFVLARVTLTGVALNTMLTRIAPRVAAMMGQRLATRAVPVLGAAAGAATNYAFAQYYQEMAHIYFGLRRMSEDSARPLPELVEELNALIAKKPAP